MSSNDRTSSEALGEGINVAKGSGLEVDDYDALGFRELVPALESDCRAARLDVVHKVTRRRLIAQADDPHEGAWLLYYYSCGIRLAYPSRALKVLQRATELNHRSGLDAFLQIVIECTRADILRRRSRNAKEFRGVREALQRAEGIVASLLGRGQSLQAQLDRHAVAKELSARVNIYQGRLAYTEARYQTGGGRQAAARSEDLVREAEAHFASATRVLSPVLQRGFWQQYAAYWHIAALAKLGDTTLSERPWLIVGWRDNPALAEASADFRELNAGVRAFLDGSDINLDELEGLLERW